MVFGSRPCSSSSTATGTLTPEERKALTDRIIRVDHAGEFGAECIYTGQVAVLGRTPIGPMIKVRNYQIVFGCHTLG